MSAPSPRENHLPEKSARRCDECGEPYMPDDPHPGLDPLEGGRHCYANAADNVCPACFLGVGVAAGRG
ncbi:MAG: hypothetical protein ACPHRO_08390 [Nannocystaceae bacterium]